MINYDNNLTPQEYNNLRESVGWNRLSDEQARRGLMNTTFLVAVKSDGVAVGMGRVLFDYGYTAYIGDIIVSPQYQGQGIGKKIMETLMASVENAADSGDQIMYILGAAKGKEEFYEKLGFVCRPSERYGAGMTRLAKVNK